MPRKESCSILQQKITAFTGRERLERTARHEIALSSRKSVQFATGISSMAYGNGRFLASGGPGDVVVSNNGITKQRVLLPGPHEGYWIVALEFNGSRFLGISYGDGLLASARRPDL